MFKVGDVVQLKSGGPSMTVDFIIGEGKRTEKILDIQLKNKGFDDGDVRCIWFEKTTKKQDFFKKDALKINESEK